MSSNSSRGSERRKYPRAKFQETILAHWVVESKSGNVFEVQGNAVEVKAKDVSEGGIRVEVQDAAPFSKIMKLNFKLPKNGNVDVYTKLAWEVDGHCGLQFVCLEDDLRKHIKGFIEKAG